MGEAIGKRTHLGQYPFQHAINIRTNIPVCKAEDVEPALHKDGVTPPVSLGIMRISVDFDNQTLCRTEEVDDPGGQNNLTSELETAQLRPAQAKPKRLLERRRLIAHLPGAIAQYRIYPFDSTHPNPSLEREGQY